MTRENIQQWAREAGIEFQQNTGITGKVRITTIGSRPIEELQRFATLARADLVEAHEACRAANTMLLYEVDAIDAT